MALSLTRKGYATAALIPLIAVGLVGCQAGEPEAVKTKPPKPTSSAQAEPEQSNPAGIPPLGGQPTTQEPAPETQAEPPASSAPAPEQTTAPNNGGNSSGDIVKWDGGDLSNIDWKVNCLTGEELLISAFDSTASPGSANTASLMVSQKEGTADEISFLLVSDGGSGSGIYLSSDSTGHGSGTMKLEGTTFTASGTAYASSDYTFSTPLEFTIQLTCDTTL